MIIGPYQLPMPVLLAPMAGITDLPFRQMVRRFGVGMSVAEMVSARPDLQHSRKHRQRRISLDEPLPRAVQIVGHDPREMANAAAFNQSEHEMSERLHHIMDHDHVLVGEQAERMRRRLIVPAAGLLVGPTPAGMLVLVK